MQFACPEKFSIIIASLLKILILSAWMIKLKLCAHVLKLILHL